MLPKSQQKFTWDIGKVILKLKWKGKGTRIRKVLKIEVGDNYYLISRPSIGL